MNTPSPLVGEGWGEGGINQRFPNPTSSDSDSRGKVVAAASASEFLRIYKGQYGQTTKLFYGIL
jgi:hypothetical protein